jgi:hypothetical protein
MACVERWLRMGSNWHDLLLFFGRFHPLLMHLPVGGLVLLGLLELSARLSRFREVAQDSRVILALVTAGLAAATPGRDPRSAMVG